MPATDLPPSQPFSSRRGFMIACGLALSVAVVNSFARFAYALILPAMREDLGWSYTLAGSLNTINALGYLAGSYIAFRTVRRWGAKHPFIVGLWVTTATVLVTGLTRDFHLIAVVRFITGISCAYVFVTGGVLAASVFPDTARNATAIAIFFGGGGAGMLVSGAVLPWMFASGGDQVWPQAWIALGLLSMAGSALATLAALPTRPPPAQGTPHPWRKLPLLAMFLAYGCFALGYFAYMTFIVAWMRQHGFGPVEVAAVWCVLGIATLVAPRIWGRAMAGWRGGRALAGILTTIGIGAALPVVHSSLTAMLLSAATFGMFFMVPAAVTAFVKKTLPPAIWGEALAAFTVVFSVLQCVGPFATGVLADVTGSLATGLGASAAMLMLGAGLALLQREQGLRAP
jgi:predicted MFS family arabinose efflux permease